MSTDPTAVLNRLEERGEHATRKGGSGKARSAGDPTNSSSHPESSPCVRIAHNAGACQSFVFIWASRLNHALTLSVPFADVGCGG
jgi:hypothetical protein